MEKVCCYCGKSTSKETTLEHILPEAVGFKETLPVGAVCCSCNTAFNNNIEQKYFHREILSSAGLVLNEVDGKKGKRAQLGHSSMTPNGELIVSGKGKVQGTSGSSHYHSTSRLIAKCFLNISIKHIGVGLTRAKMSEMISFVTSPKTKEEIWPMAYYHVPELSTPATYRVKPYINSSNVESFICEIIWPGSIFCITSERNNQVHNLCKDVLDKFLNENPESKKCTKFGFTIKHND